MPHFSPILFALAFATMVVALTAFGRRLPVPAPLLQVLAGLAVGFVPGVSMPTLDPDVVFFVFLPPILWAAAFFTSFREFTANRRAIGGLAIGLVVATTAVVAVIARMLIPDMPWAVAVALGAIVSPPDAVAATAVVSRLPVPSRVIVILEGESLVNDASALVLYRAAVAAAVTGAFSFGEALVRFFLDAGVGVLVGLAIGWLTIAVARRTRDELAETVLTLAAPYAAWVLAETLHVSAVLACVAGGLYARQHLSTAVGPRSRIQSRAVWDLLVFTLNALIFILLGLQFAELMQQSGIAAFDGAVKHGVLMGVVVMVVRLLWVPVTTICAQSLGRGRSVQSTAGNWKSMFLVSWTSMRGIVSLATAFALPLTLDSGARFPYRAELIIMTMCVILVTLVVQGLSLAPIIRAFKFAPEAEHHEEEHIARQEALRRAAEALEDASHEPWADPADVAWLRSELRDRQHRHTHRSHANHDSRSRLRSRMLDAERRMLLRLRNEGAISDEVLRTLEAEIDLDTLRLSPSS